MIPLNGSVSPAFEPLRSAFAALFASGAETGAALTVIHDGAEVVSLCGGWRDSSSTVPWTPDTLAGVYSVGKPVAALCVLLLVARGRLSLDDPVARHWPEFSTPAATIRQLLDHTAGTVAFPPDLPSTAFADWDLLASSLAATPPAWEPGTVAGEFALTYGHALGELVRRVDGRTLGTFLREEIAVPWDLDLAFGLSPSQIDRCADLVPAWPADPLGSPGTWKHRALSSPAGATSASVINGPLWRATEIPAVNLHSTATALARLYTALPAILPPWLVTELTTASYTGPDLVLNRDVTWTLGMQLEPDGSYGMGGIGGSCAFTDPTRNYTFAYVTHHLTDSQRVDHLVDTLNESLEGR
ncbi:CubicO group peptidase (beta-lactamase class C family) [Catenuloplanes nepalensis]|uniref:CubicO group peptidase (Beta-lactamase class C family) n=1 Tax=Catenuloplanes nepalensis TaxID=587533 RepID=A0ABT9N4V5_9ACTN|nr:serine hydrolase domain-containing protein [Catenuloplanes nepalensis]MDP9798291.1 CubicO group peptidase (beta-lactamase class C family) [Catenuloplanes nepalensis]